MKLIKNKLNKPLIIISYITVVWMGLLFKMKEMFHMNSDLNDAFANFKLHKKDTGSKIPFGLYV